MDLATKTRTAWSKIPGGLSALKEGRFFYGWWIVFVGFMAEFVGAGATSYSFGVFFKPMTQEMGWTRTMTSGAVTIRSVAMAFISSLVGPAVDRIGPRAIMVGGSIVTGITFMLMSQITDIPQYYLLYGVIGSIGMAGEGTLVTMTTITKWFVRMRGRATAFATIGVSIAGVVFTPLSAYLIVSYGWRASWVALGLASIILLTPLAAIFMRRQPEDMGLRPDGDPAPAPTPSRPGSSSHSPSLGSHREVSWTPKAAFKTPALWLILIAFNLSSMSISSILLHQINYMTDKGFSPGEAAAVVSFYALLAALAKLIWGFVAERVHIRYLDIACFVGGGIGILILVYARSVEALFLFALVYGLTRGAYVLLTPLTWANYFGREFIGTIRGILAPFGIISSAGGQLFAAVVYDVSKSYDLAFLIFSATFMAGAFFMFLAKPPSPPERELAA